MTVRYQRREGTALWGKPEGGDVWSLIGEVENAVVHYQSADVGTLETGVATGAPMSVEIRLTEAVGFTAHEAAAGEQFKRFALAMPDHTVEWDGDIYEMTVEKPGLVGLVVNVAGEVQIDAGGE